MSNANPSQRTRFKPGNAGRPKGVPDKRSSLRALLDPHAKDLVGKLVELAKAGDTTALRICIDRLIPVPKSRDEAIALAGLTGSPAESGRAVVAAVGAGELTPEQGNVVMGVLANQARLIESEDIERRLRALEDAHAKK